MLRLNGPTTTDTAAQHRSERPQSRRRVPQ
jgi:hypothetical protein